MLIIHQNCHLCIFASEFDEKVQLALIFVSKRFYYKRNFWLYKNVMIYFKWKGQVLILYSVKRVLFIGLISLYYTLLRMRSHYSFERVILTLWLRMLSKV